MDWIKSRTECSPEHAWFTLKERMAADLDQWRASQNEFVRGRTSFHREDRLVTVSRRSGMTHEIEAFLSVKMRGESDIVFARTPQGEEEKLIASLNVKGECRLIYNGKELEFWQASRLLLEPVLF